MSPSSPIDPELCEKGLDHWRSQDFEIQLGRHALDAANYLAGSDRDRAADIMAAFTDPKVDCVYCSRGGYGAARLVPYLDFDVMARSGKMFIGFSDITTLHLALNQRGLVTFYAPMALSLAFPRANWVFESLWRMISGHATIPVAAPNAQCVVPGVVEGTVTGGCMCLLCDSMRTPYEWDTKGKILLIEDVDEAPHRVDAMLTQLLNAGKLQDAAGVLIGEMTRSDSSVDAGIGGAPWIEIVTERLRQAGVPSAVNFPMGHAPNMLSLALGVRARFDATLGRLEYLESPCEE